MIACVLSPADALARRPGAGQARREPTASSGSGDPAVLDEPVGEVALSQALALALLHNPDLQAASFEVRAREAARLQAGLLPNPAVDTEAEDIGMSPKDVPNISQPQTTVRLSQLIELGGKRRARVRVASADAELAAWDYEARRLDVLTRTVEAFVALLGAQERLRLANDTVALAERVAGTVSARVEAGVVSPVEATKARVAVANAEVDRQAAIRALDAARQRLALTWASEHPTFDRAAGTLPAVGAIPSEDALAARLAQNPDLARWDAEMAKRQAAVAAETAKRIPDVTLTAGYRKFHDTADNTLVVGGSIPLPILNQNQGAIAEARARQEGAVRERRSAETRLRADLTEAYRALASARSAADLLGTSVLPGAQSAFDAAQEGYQLGKFGFLDVLDAQRTLFAARVQHLNALVAFHTAAAEVERLVGEPLDPARAAGGPR